MSAKRARKTIGCIGLGNIIGSTYPLWWLVAAHWHDPRVAVLHPGTLATYAAEIWLQTDAVGPAATVAAWIGLILLVIAISGPAWIPRRTAQQAEA